MDIQSLTIYLPQDRRHALGRGVMLPDRMTGSALFADISGFTPLTETLTRTLGPRHGAEELSIQLNRVYTALIAQVDRFGGTVIGFSGDAITCWFDNHSFEFRVPSGRLSPQLDQSDTHHASALRAVTCALALQDAMRAFAALALPGSMVSLGLKVAVTSGPARRFLVGDPAIQWIDVLAGATVVRLAAAEHLAITGEVLADAPTATLLADRLQVIAWRSDPSTGQAFAHIGGILPSHGDDRSVASLRTHDTEDDAATKLLHPAPPVALTDEQLRPWLLPAVYERLRAGLGEFLTELRPSVALFLRFNGLDYDADADVGTKLDAYICWVQGVLARYEGTLLQLTIGDKGSYLYAAFGAPVAHAREARRAVRAALELRTPPPDLAFAGPVQIGLSQGTARAGAYGGPTRHTYGVLGDEVNVAARLMQLAAPGEVLVGGRVHGAAVDSFAGEPLPSMTVKGKATPIPLYRPLAALPAPLAYLQPSTVPILVGRHAERAALAAALDTLLRGAGGTLVIEGEAGIGKSQLVADLLHQAQTLDLTVLVGAGEAVEQATPYYAWRPVFQQLFGLDVLSDDLEARRTHVLAQLANDEALQERAPLLNVVLALNLPETALTAPMQGQVRADNTNALLLNLLRQAAQRRPLLIVLEDVHWLDSAAWTLARRLGQELPALLVLTTRPPTEPLPDAYRQLRDGTTTRWLHLAPLPAEDILALVGARLGVTSLPEPVAVLIQTKAEGNPFFSVELALALRAMRVLQIAEGTCQIRPGVDLQTVDVPDTIQGAVASRIDRLTPAQQLTLKVASVIGRVFALRTLRDVHPLDAERPRLPDQLALLARLELVLLETPEPHLAYMFKHVITQEVAYSLLAAAQRRQLHHAVAAWYERTLTEEQTTARAGLLAYHWGEAEVVDKAITYLDLAGAHALQNGIYREAAAFLRRALALTSESSDGDQPGERELTSWKETLAQARRERLLAEALLGLGQMAGSLDHAARALALLGTPIPVAPFPLVSSIASQAAYQMWRWVSAGHLAGTHHDDPADVERIEAYLICWRVAYYDSNAPLVVYVNLHALRLAARYPRLPHQALFLVGAGLLADFAALAPVANAYLRWAAQVAHAANDPKQVALTILLNGIYQSGLGQWAGSHAHLREARAVFEAQRDWRSWMDAMFGHAFNWYYQGELARSRATFQLVGQVAHERSGGQPAAGAIGGQGLIALREGRIELAVALLEETAATAGAALLEINAYGALALAAWRLGRRAAARVAADAAAQHIARTTPVSFIAVEGYAGMAEVYLALWRQAPYDRQLERSARWACRSLRLLSWAFPIAQPQAWRCQGGYDWICGRRRQALRAWHASSYCAAQLAMPYEEGLAHYELGRHLPASDPRRRHHLAHAVALFARLGADDDLRRAIAVVRHGGSGADPAPG